MKTKSHNQKEQERKVGLATVGSANLIPSDTNKLKANLTRQCQRRNRGDDEQLYSSKASISRMGSSCKPQSLSSDISKEQDKDIKVIIDNCIKGIDKEELQYTMDLAKLKWIKQGRKDAIEEFSKKLEIEFIENNFVGGKSIPNWIKDKIDKIKKELTNGN